MKIYKKSDKRVLAELDKNDIRHYRLDINSLSLDDSGTKELLYDVALMSEIDFGIKSRLYIDSFAVSESCVFVAVTLVSRLRRYRIRRKTQLVACRLNRPYQLYSVCEELACFSNSIFGSRLLFDGITYTLMLCPESKKCRLIENTLLKYGKPIRVNSDFEKAILSEHNRLICENFIEKLLL